MTSIEVAILLASITASIVMIDYWLWRDDIPGNTFSSVIRDTWRKHRWFGMGVVWFTGFLAGHWFW